MNECPDCNKKDDLLAEALRKIGQLELDKAKLKRKADYACGVLNGYITPKEWGQ